MDRKIKVLFIFIIIVLMALGLYGYFQANNTFNQNQISDNSTISENGQYNSRDDVALYIEKFHKLPSNYITKSDARKLGWKGGSVEEYAPGKSIGGDRFTNRQEVLPSGENYIECDIDTNGTESRGSKRIVYSTTDYDIYYTSNHYKTFTKLN